MPRQEALPQVRTWRWDEGARDSAAMRHPLHALALLGLLGLVGCRPKPPPVEATVEQVRLSEGKNVVRVIVKTAKGARVSARVADPTYSLSSNPYSYCTAATDSCTLEVPLEGFVKLDKSSKSGSSSSSAVRIEATVGTRKTATTTKDVPFTRRPTMYQEPGKSLIEASGVDYNVTVAGSMISFKVSGPGSYTIDLGGSKASGTGGATATYDASSAYVSTPASNLTSTSTSCVGLTIPLNLTLDGKPLFNGKLQRGCADYKQGWGFNKTDFTPVVFGARDVAPPGARRGLLFGQTLIGTPATLGEIDLVAAEVSESRRRVGCGSYSNSTGNTITLSGNVITQTLEVRERRTGKVVARRPFTGKGTPCPENISLKKGASGNVDAGDVSPTMDVKQAWLKSLVKS